jgi:hypothetical protein
MCSVGSGPVFAQGKKVAQGIVKATTRSASQLAPAVNTSTQILAKRGINATVASGIGSVANGNIVAAQQRTLLQQVVHKNKRLIIGAQVNMGVPLRTAVERALLLGALPEKHLPPVHLLKENAFPLQDITPLALSEEVMAQETPRLPFSKKENLIFRGISLTPDVVNSALRNILENGLLLKDVGVHASDRNLAMTAGPGGLGSVLAMSKPVINLTDTPQDALKWANIRSGKAPEFFRVIISVRSENIGRVINVQRDIPTDELSEVIILANLNGEKTWCKVELEGEDFLITPYEVDFLQELL